MPTYVAMLRGINVGGHHRVTMDRLRESFASLGLKNLQTYIQSGNLVFQAARASPSTLRQKMEEKFAADFGFPSLVILRTQEELAQAIAANPFLKPSGSEIDHGKMHVIFLSAPPAADVLKQLQGFTKAPDQSFCAGQEIYVHVPNGFARSSLANNPIERKFLAQSTTRNWRTVNTLHQMCLDCR